jgi:hypothetical protein
LQHVEKDEKMEAVLDSSRGGGRLAVEAEALLMPLSVSASSKRREMICRSDAEAVLWTEGRRLS